MTNDYICSVAKLLQMFYETLTKDRINLSKNLKNDQ